MPLRVVRRKDTGAVTIDGRVNGKRYQRRAQSQTIALAREEAAAWEAEILRTAWYGERRGVHTFSEAVIKYLEAKPRKGDARTADGRHRGDHAAQRYRPGHDQQIAEGNIRWHLRGDSVAQRNHAAASGHAICIKGQAQMVRP